MSQTKILVVDDDPKLSRLVKVVLEKTKLYEVIEENRSANALTVARGLRPRAILMDVDMPGKDGGELAREIAADRDLAKTPIMFLTSLISSNEAGQHEVVRAGKWFLAKPVKPEVLIKSVARLVSSHPNAAATA
jgi:two-component system, cell cycle response regulator DivK